MFVGLRRTRPAPGEDDHRRRQHQNGNLPKRGKYGRGTPERGYIT